MTTPSPWWHPHVHADRRPFLAARGRIRTRLRRFFEDQDFVEVESAALQISPGNEAHLNAFATELHGLDGSRTRLYLHTSPEFSCKKLLAAGERRIFEFARVFRNRERGALHSPEFTLLEWYRTGEPYEALMADCARILALAAEETGTRSFSFRDRACDPFAEHERLTVAEAFATHAGVDLLATVSGGEGDRDALAAAAEAIGVRIEEEEGQEDTWSDIFSRILVERVEPRLGLGRPTILCEYPVCEAALARPKPGDPQVAERFELYACGVELANGFGELTDPHEQHRRFEIEMAEKERVYGERYPIDEDFIAALAHMPEASGIALGFDRLVMLATGAGRVDQVMWTPVAEPQPGEGVQD
ncbi:EF-P lysine aminoacylase EpmA [Chelatococcus sp. SYSU_G07232]|uniref:EF-P lysine aminoacylase EpmA n=1 Tax=Chelatococcus albus TaxID=3047466 RepID=A0ABT7AHS1_9HYPH|nr:EF-P lysine aminoacylase EpmA [Chelatococcus sp. SYSU_G07232]MDJ1158927.1 EF-P lysine aminoacylase EpmA [Chelatococcus sp. SYSU_G07232]